MTSNIDRRSQRTRTALMTAFVELLLEHGYEPLSVQQVVDRANVGRSTFYAHYAGLAALLKESLARPCLPLAGLIDDSQTVPHLGAMLIHMRDQPRLIRALLKSPLRELWVARLAELIEERLHPTLARDGLPLPRCLVATEIAECQIGMISSWLTAARSVSADRIAEALTSATGAMLAALFRPA